MRGDGVALDTNAEELRLEQRNAGLLVVLVLEYLVKRVRHALTRPETVRWLVLVAVRHPVVDRARTLQLLAEVLGDLEALDAVLDPELADLGIGIGERQAVRSLRMREERRIEVELHADLLSPHDPRLEVLDVELVAVNDLVLVDAVAGVQVHTVLAGNERERELEVLLQLLGRAGLARIVAGRLNAARGATRSLEPADVVALPAMEGNGDLVEILQDLFRVNADLGILLLRFVVAHGRLMFEVGIVIAEWPRGPRQGL